MSILTITPPLKNTYQLAYCSISTVLLTKDELFDIVSSAMIYNACDGISGVLIYFNNIFFQILEGPKEKVNHLFSRVKKDTRHRDIEIIWAHPVSMQTFQDWSMANMDYDCLGSTEKLMFEKLEDQIRQGRRKENKTAKSMLLDLIKENIEDC